jgi:putative hydrolase of the HAD superfamily
MTVLMLDVDGVLVTDKSDRFAYDAVLDQAIEEARALLSVEDWQSVATGRADLLAILSSRLPEQSDPQRLLDYWFASETHVDPAVLAGVRRVRANGTRVYLATNQEHHRARYLQDTLGLLAQVDGIAYSAALGHRKPSPEYFAAAAAKVGAHPADIVFIDDNEGNVDAARVAGWRAILWLGDMSLEEAISAAR